MTRRHPFMTGIVEAFASGNLPVIVILLSLVAGAIALWVTPREEEPQIVVPLADVLVQYPGGDAGEVERLVASRLERMLSQIDGVEYVYSMSRPGSAVVTVRFFVGEDREDSLVKLYNKLQQNMDSVTPGITGWVVKPVEIDDVPIVSATLHASRYDTHALYRVAEEVAGRLQHIPDSARITLHGGPPREVGVYLDPERLSGHGLGVGDVAGALRSSNVQADVGEFDSLGHRVSVRSGAFLQTAEDVRNLVIGIRGDRPVYLRDVADVRDGPAEAVAYTRFSLGPASRGLGDAVSASEPAVTVALAKKRGSNAVRVARQVRAALEGMRGSVIPDEVGVRITRDYGATANDKVNNLVQSLALAIVTVVGLLALTLHWRAGLVVALAVPITYSLSLLCNLLLGYTINRVTLFALILALGLIVDDPIAGVENIERHLRKRTGSRLDAVLAAMDEIMPPVLLSTLAIIVAFTPMFFITGMMGPYMRPMALNVPIAVTFSTVVALTVTPWLSRHLLSAGRGDAPAEAGPNPRMLAIYRRVLGPLVGSRRRAAWLLTAVALLFCGSALLALTGRVPLKMLPFDNKNEFQVLVDMPESATLEQTDAVARDIEAFLQTVPEVTDVTTTVGASSPMDFNGLVRHYYLRAGSNVADLRVNLLSRVRRRADSHALVLRLRRELEAIGRRHGASVKAVEVPPGPPVLSTLVAEVYGTPYHAYDQLIAAAGTVKARLAAEAGVVDVDDTVETDRTELFFRVDKDKAARNGIGTHDVAAVLQLALDGATAGVVHAPGEQNELPIRLRVPRAARSSAEDLRKLVVQGRTGQQVQLGELGAFEQRVVDRTIHHKNNERVVYVTAEIAGRGPAYAILALQSHFRRNPLPSGIRVDWRGEGEWKITLDVFRDLGAAFGVALLGIYALLVYETGSFLLPVVIMLSIPLTVIGIMPGFGLLNAVSNRPVGGFDNPVFFTATAMIGMIALSGIVVRNAIVLIDFIRTQRAEGQDVHEAIVTAGAVRMRPILLTAGTTLLGAWPITLDPIFSGLAWALIFGLFVSTAFTLVVVPVVYALLYGQARAAAT